MAIERESTASASELPALRAEVARLREEAKHAAARIRELTDAVAARDAFIAIAGHELRNPMSAIVVGVTNIAHVIAQGNQPLPEWFPPRFAALERQARTFVRRATTLLDVSRVTSGQLRLDPETVDAAEVTRSVLDHLAVEIERARCPLTTAIERAVPGWWDRVALDQIVYNLVSNAAKYGAGKPIHVSLVAAGGRAILRVADKGIGISPADRERIFARFERAVTERGHGGFGLGLWIAHQLVDASGGTIRVESTPGAGSIFTVELPQAIDPSAQ